MPSKPKKATPKPPKKTRLTTDKDNVKKRSRPAITAQMTADALLVQQIKNEPNAIDSYFLNPSDIVRGVALPSAPTDEIVKAMAHLVRHGNFPDVAARSLGISVSVFRAWVEEGLRNPNSQYGKMLRALDAADAQDEVTDINLISMGLKHWTALAWKRERKSQRRWGAKIPNLVPFGVDELAVPDADKQQFKQLEPTQVADILSTLHQIGAFQSVAGGAINPMQEAQVAEAAANAAEDQADEDED